MARKRFKPEQIIPMLREADVKLAAGSTTSEVCRAVVIPEQIYYRWRKEYELLANAFSNYQANEHLHGASANEPAIHDQTTVLPSRGKCSTIMNTKTQAASRQRLIRA